MSEGFPKNRTFTVHEGGKTGEVVTHSERPPSPPERSPRSHDCESKCMSANQRIQFLQGIAQQRDPNAHDKHANAESIRRKLVETSEYDDDPDRAITEVRRHLGMSEGEFDESNF